MGNAWSQNRLSFGRPQVCKPPVKQPPAAETDFACTIDPDGGTVEEFEGFTFTAWAFDPDEDPSSEIDVTWVADGGTIEGPTEIDNDGEGVYDWSDDSGPGTYTQTITFTSAGGRVCEQSFDITVEEPP